MNNYVYLLGGKAYINLTNKCSNACSFCIRNSGDGVAGTPLWLDKDPTAEEVIAAFERIDKKDDEAVFCGYGEPTENSDVLIAVAKYLKQCGYRTRLNTNGLGNLVSGRDITSELAGIIDVVSISLNAAGRDKYFEITNSKYGPDAFDAMIAFAECCKARGINTVFTVVDTVGENEIDKCKALCAELEIPLRIREYIANNYDE